MLVSLFTDFPVLKMIERPLVLVCVGWQNLCLLQKVPHPNPKNLWICYIKRQREFLELLLADLQNKEIILDYLDKHNVITRVHGLRKREVQETECYDVRRSQPTSTSFEKWGAVECEGLQQQEKARNDFSLDSPKSIQCCWHLNPSQWNLCWTPEPQNYKTINILF